MFILAIILGSAAVLLCGGWLYSSLIARLIGEDPRRPTPAVQLADGQDYVPTPTPVVFAHHFASIAGAGPIVGPIFALVYGWGPALIWIVLGGIIAGGVHDYVAMFVSMRERGKSIAVIAREAMGRTAFICFIALLVVLLILVCAQFLTLSAKALTSQLPLEELGLGANQTTFKTVVVEEKGAVVTRAVVGGIASTSVLVITFCAPLVGWMYIKRHVPVWICSLISLAICLLSVAIGLMMPISFSPPVWMLLISLYCIAAAGFPVWMFLQSRDFINVHLLYFGMAILVAAVFLTGVSGAQPSMEMVDITRGDALTGGSLWPFLFITVSCGAMSGFHALCATGTTPKQLKSERSARYVGYWGMLLESFLAVCVVTACLVAMPQAEYLKLVYPAGPGAVGNPVLAFGRAVGHACQMGFEPLTKPLGFGFPVAYGTVFAMLLLEGFIITTLDTAVRLTRYLLEELWATLFCNVDLFVEAAQRENQLTNATSTLAADGSVVPAGGAGLATSSAIPAAGRTSRVIPTRGIVRLGLQVLRSYWFNSGLVVGLMLWLANSPVSNALWPIFGSGNQLLAALALLSVSAWLIRAGRPAWYTLIPCAFMMVTTLTSLVMLLVNNYLRDLENKWPLAVFDLIILTLTTILLICAAMSFATRRAPAGTGSLEGQVAA